MPAIPTQLYRCHLLPLGSSVWKDRAMLRWLARPTANSITMTGRPMITRNSK